MIRILFLFFFVPCVWVCAGITYLFYLSCVRVYVDILSILRVTFYCFKVHISHTSNYTSPNTLSFSDLKKIILVTKMWTEKHMDKMGGMHSYLLLLIFFCFHLKILTSQPSKSFDPVWLLINWYVWHVFWYVLMNGVLSSYTHNYKNRRHFLGLFSFTDDFVDTDCTMEKIQIHFNKKFNSLFFMIAKIFKQQNWYLSTGRKRTRERTISFVSNHSSEWSLVCLCMCVCESIFSVRVGCVSLCVCVLTFCFCSS